MLFLLLISFGMVNRATAYGTCNISYLTDASPNAVGLLQWPQVSKKEDLGMPPSFSLLRQTPNVKVFSNLRVAYLVRKGFKEFNKMEVNIDTFEVEAVGLCTDVFKEVMNLMPEVSYTLLPVKALGGSLDLTLDHLSKKLMYDVLVGDVTITLERSRYVDFTFPFMDAGIAAVVPIKSIGRSDPWIFLKPMTPTLWLTIGCLLFLNAFVVWTIEHDNNNDFGSALADQLMTSCWFSLSSVVYSHREPLRSNIARFYTNVWLLTVVVIMSCYVANLGYMVVFQSTPTFTDIQELIESGETIGYQDGSFVLDFLKHMKVKKVKNYTSFEEYDKALSDGSRNGGVAAIVDEIPYMKLFISKYCRKYALIDPTYETPGFGFAFPKDSPLVDDVSRAILKLRESGEIRKISNKWLQRKECPGSGDGTEIKILTVVSLMGIILLHVLSALIALVVSWLNVYKKRSCSGSKVASEYGTPPNEFENIQT